MFPLFIAVSGDTTEARILPLTWPNLQSLTSWCTVGRFRGSGGGSFLNLKSLNYVLVCYSLSFVSIM